MFAPYQNNGLVFSMSAANEKTKQVSVYFPEGEAFTLYTNIVALTKSTAKDNPYRGRKVSEVIRMLIEINLDEEVGKYINRK